MDPSGAFPANGSAGAPFDDFRERVHRGVLRAAAAYNLAFGLWTVLDPQGFFRLFRLDPPRYPAVWSCLGMVVGLYGLGYAVAAARPALRKPFVAIGLLGKTLGPIGWVLAVRSGEWPVRTLPLVVFDDLVWWMPFCLILLEGTRAGERLRAAAPWACAVANGLATLAMAALLRPGTEVGGDVAARSAWVAAHPAAWRGGWALWVVAGASLVTFYAWWASRVAARGRALLAVGIAAAGFACDVAAESLYAAWLPLDFEPVARAGTLLTGAVANGLYTVAAAILLVASPDLPRGLRAWAWAWIACGVALTVASVAGSSTGLAVSTGALMALFCPWCVAMGLRFRSRPA